MWEVEGGKKETQCKKKNNNKSVKKKKERRLTLTLTPYICGWLQAENNIQWFVIKVERLVGDDNMVHADE